VRTKIKDILSSEQVDYDVVVKGWVRSFRNNQFIALNDGSIIDNLQIVIAENSEESLVKAIQTGAALSIEGKVVSSQGKGWK
jgi:asparaginyl-tRNA synthetase